MSFSAHDYEHRSQILRLSRSHTLRMLFSLRGTLDTRMDTLSNRMAFLGTGKGTQIGCCERSHQYVWSSDKGTVRARTGLAGRRHEKQSSGSESLLCWRSAVLCLCVWYATLHGIGPGLEMSA